MIYVSKYITKCYYLIGKKTLIIQIDDFQTHAAWHGSSYL